MTPAATAKTLIHNLTKRDDDKKSSFLTQNTVPMLEIEFLSFVGWMIIGENKEAGCKMLQLSVITAVAIIRQPL